jgi:hypothetical protein
VRVHALNLALRKVHTHKKVHTVYTHMIMVRRVYAVLAERKGVWLVHAQYEYNLSHDSVINGAMRRVKCMWNISARYKNRAQHVSMQEPKLCIMDIGTQRKSSARNLLARRRRNA